MSNPVTAAAALFEVGLMLAGFVLLVRWLFGPAARQHRVTAALAPWHAPVADFATFIVYVIAGWLFFGAVAGLTAKGLKLAPSATLIFGGAAGQIGWLVGVVAYRLQFERPIPTDAPPRRHVLGSGVMAFLVSLPVLALTGAVWRWVLKLAGYPVTSQDLIGIFARVDSPVMLVIMVVLAVIVAPVAEELVFRGGLFRYFRTRMRPSLALLAPAILFAVLHANLASFVPLVVLALVFSIAYEQTGHIGTPIVAHALFNLNTVALIFSGVADIV